MNNFLLGLRRRFAGFYVAGSGLCFVAFSLLSPAYGQPNLVKAEELVRSQSIPFSRVMTFEYVNPPESWDYLAWLVTRRLDLSNAWGPQNIGWSLYLFNVRLDLEERFRLRWQTAAGSIRSLAQSAPTSLGKHYADNFTEEELEDALRLYKSPAGKKFLAYQNNLRLAYYRGRLVLEQARFDSSLGPSSQSDTDLQRNWLMKNRLPPESANEAYAFHGRTLQQLFPSVPLRDLIFGLVAGAVPGTLAMIRIDSALSNDERQQIDKYLLSAAHAKELVSIRAWHDAVFKTLDLLPIFLGDVRSLSEVLAHWQKTRSDPLALPRSLATVKPSDVLPPDTLVPVRLEEDGVKLLKQCLPSISESVIEDFEKFIATKKYLTSSRTNLMSSEANFFLSRGEFGACVRTTPAGFPILAIDSFSGSIEGNGLSEAVTRDWYAKVAQEIAAFGHSKSLLVLSGGNAFEIQFAVSANSPDRILYSSRLLTLGSFKSSDYQIVKSVPTLKSLTLSATVMPNGSRLAGKSILSTPQELKRSAELRNQD